METAHQQDLYEALQVSPHAHPLIIAKAYRLLAALYHPDNKQTGDADGFRRVAEAYRVLSDPVQRAAYHKEHFGPSAPKPTSCAANDAEPTVGRRPDERELRPLLLRALYDVRRGRPYKPGLSLIVLAELSGCSIDDLQFTLWYLRGKRLIEMTEDSEVVITVTGVDFLETHGLAGTGAARPEADGASDFQLPGGLTTNWPLALTGNRNGSGSHP